MKKCGKCKETKSLSEFYKCKEKGYRCYCKKCNNKTRKEYIKTPSYIYNKVLERAKLKNRDICSKEEFSLWYNRNEKFCAYCHIPEEMMKYLTITHRNGYIVKKRLEIDRANNLKGYTLENLMLACPICNEVKGRILTRREMLSVGLVIEKRWQKELTEKGVW